VERVATIINSLDELVGNTPLLRLSLGGSDTVPDTSERHLGMIVGCAPE
jgi:hypothetical protein